jgi:hypothetical protein
MSKPGKEIQTVNRFKITILLDILQLYVPTTGVRMEEPAWEKTFVCVKMDMLAVGAKNKVRWK